MDEADRDKIIAHLQGKHKARAESRRAGILTVLDLIEQGNFDVVLGIVSEAEKKRLLVWLEEAQKEADPDKRTEIERYIHDTKRELGEDIKRRKMI